MNHEHWKQAETALACMEVFKNGENDPVTIEGESDDLPHRNWYGSQYSYTNLCRLMRLNCIAEALRSGD